jgi:general secretion pathway protein E
MAKLDIAEHRLPQDGRMKLRLGNKEVDLRVSTLPVTHGERIVLRLLDQGNIKLGLEYLHMSSDTLRQLRQLICLPEGILLVTGPTGSGKTTTLYSALTEIASDELNIITIEDPIEYKLMGIAQMGVKPKIGLTFAKGLRHILRQDPDVIMVGEIRDRETAEIAIQAALTGHLVISTLHTNDAPSALIRLMDMGIEPYLLLSTIIGVVAQRLVRILCPHCRSPYALKEGEGKELGLTFQTIYTPSGCDQCFGSGYKGRQAIFELMPMTSAIKNQFAQRNVQGDHLALKEVAIRMGMRTLAQEGASLVKQGVTSMAEVLRVTRGVES